MSLESSPANSGVVMRVSNVLLYGYHGVSAAERQVGTRIEVDVDLRLAPAERDTLASTIDYREIYRVLEEIVTGRRFKLLETIARAIRAELLARFPASHVRVRVRKPNVPFPGGLSHVEVEVGEV